MKRIAYRGGSAATLMVFTLSGVLSSARAAIIAGNAIDLDNQPGQTYTDGSGAIWSTADIHPAGNGVFMPFIRQTSPGSSPWEQGFNTDAPKQADNLGGAWTHSLRLADISQVVRNGIAYYQFAMNANQTGVEPIISIDKVEIFQTNTAALTDYDGANMVTGSPTDHFGQPAMMVYSEDAVIDTTINLNSRQNNGQGIGTADMTLLVPVALFTGNQQYVVLYSSFGDPNFTGNGNGNGNYSGPTGGFYPANAGFEDWNATEGATRTPPGVPLPSVASGGMAILGLAALVHLRRGRRIGAG